MIVARLLLTLALLSPAACASQRSDDDCKELCQREARCVDDVARQPAALKGGAGDDGEDADQNRFDQSECVAACSALLRDATGEGKKLVDRHKRCAAAAADCAALLRCE